MKSLNEFKLIDDLDNSFTLNDKGKINFENNSGQIVTFSLCPDMIKSLKRVLNTIGKVK